MKHKPCQDFIIAVDINFNVPEPLTQIFLQIFGLKKNAVIL